MISTLSKLLDLLTPRERRQSYLLLCMIIVMGLLDVIGVASIMPFMSVLTNPEVIQTNKYLAAVYKKIGSTDNQTFIFFLGIMVLLTLVVSIAFKAFTTYAMLRFGHMRNYSLSRRLVEGYLHQPYEWFLNRNSSDLGAAILSEVGQVVTGALIPMIKLIANGVVVLFLLTLIVVIDPMLATIVTLVLGVAYAVIYLLMRGYLGRIGLDRVKANQERFKVVNEAFGGIKDVKISGLENSFLQQYQGPAERFARRLAASQIGAQLPRFALEIVTFGGMLLVVLYLMAGTGGLQQVLPLIALYAFAGYRLMPALQQVYTQLSALRFSAPGLVSLHKDLKEFASDNILSGIHKTAPSIDFVHELKLANIIYTYPRTNRPSLNELSLEIPVHTTIGIVGATGSGKTTVVDIVLGLLRPDKGQLLVDDALIDFENVRSWQNKLGYVPQQIYLADNSVAANIAFGVPSNQIDYNAVENAARIANLHNFVTNQMPKGYETVIGERGVRLSGGQRQRIGIARALYHDPEVLILDEATSALDNLTEQAVMGAVHNLGHSKTIILIAHRLTTVRNCDQIFFLHNGQLVGKGNYSELIEKNTNFRTMANSNS